MKSSNHQFRRKSKPVSKELPRFRNAKKLSIIMCTTFSFFLVEFVFGLLSRSIALLADSFHMLSDVLSLVVALICVKVGKICVQLAGCTCQLFQKQLRLRSSRGSWSSGMPSILPRTLQINSVFLLSICFCVFLEALSAIVSPHAITKPLHVLIVGIIGLLINVLSLLILHGGEKWLFHHRVKGMATPMAGTRMEKRFRCSPSPRRDRHL